MSHHSDAASCGEDDSAAAGAASSRQLQDPSASSVQPPRTNLGAMLAPLLIIVGVGVTQCIANQMSSASFGEPIDDNYTAYVVQHAPHWLVNGSIPGGSTPPDGVCPKYFRSPISLTWFCMNFLLLLYIPWTIRLLACCPREGRGPNGLRSSRSVQEQFGDDPDAQSRGTFLANDSFEGVHALFAATAEGMGRKQRNGPAAAPTSPEDATVYDNLPATAEQRLTCRGICKAIGVRLLLYVLYMIANVAAIVALAHLPAVICSSIFSTATPFVCALSWVMLNRRHAFVSDSLAVVLAVTGALLITHPWQVTLTDHQAETVFTSAATTPAGPGTTGVPAPAAAVGPSRISVVGFVCIALASPVATAFYKVTFSKLFQGVSWLSVGCLLAQLATINVIVGTPLLAIALHFGAETNPVACPPPWPFALGGAAAQLIFNFLLNYGVTIMAPLYVSIGSVIATGLNLLATLWLDSLLPEPTLATTSTSASMTPSASTGGGATTPSSSVGPGGALQTAAGSSILRQIQPVEWVGMALAALSVVVVALAAKYHKQVADRTKREAERIDRLGFSDRDVFREPTSPTA